MDAWPGESLFARSRLVICLLSKHNLLLAPLLLADGSIEIEEDIPPYALVPELRSGTWVEEERGRVLFSPMGEGPAKNRPMSALRDPRVSGALHGHLSFTAFWPLRT